MTGIYVVQYPSWFIGLLYCKTGPTQSWVFKHAALIHTLCILQEMWLLETHDTVSWDHDEYIIYTYIPWSLSSLVSALLLGILSPTSIFSNFLYRGNQGPLRRRVVQTMATRKGLSKEKKRSCSSSISIILLYDNKLSIER